MRPASLQLRRLARHEWTLAVAAGLLLSLVLNRGALADPAHTLPEDIWDPSLVAYLIAWGGHALVHSPGNLWDLNTFYPAPYGLAYTDSLLGYAPFAVLGTGPEATILRYNLIYIFAQALVFIGAYALVRQLGARPAGAALAAVAFGVAPWRLAQSGHLHVLSTGGMMLALAMLARGHGVTWFRPDGTKAPPKRPWWALAGWLVAAWQMTIGFGIGLVFLYVLLGVCVVAVLIWAVRSWTPSRHPGPPHEPVPVPLLLADAGGGLVFAAVSLLMAQPYLKVLELYPYARRDERWVELYSPPLYGYLVAPPESLVWGAAHEPMRATLGLPAEMALLPGFALYAFAAAGLFISIWSLSLRLALLAGVFATIALGLGTNGLAGGKLGYLLLLENLPGFEGLRTPGRLVIWTTLLLGLLAAGGLSAVVARRRDAAPGYRTRLVAAAALLPVALVLVEGLGVIAHPRVPAPPAALATVEAPYLVLPSDEMRDLRVMVWSTDRFADVVNGGSGLVPAEVDQTRKAVRSFPDATSVAYLRDIGVRTVVLLPSLAAGTPWQSAAAKPVDGLGITREVTPGAVVYHLL